MSLLDLLLQLLLLLLFIDVSHEEYILIRRYPSPRGHLNIHNEHKGPNTTHNRLTPEHYHPPVHLINLRTPDITHNAADIEEEGECQLVHSHQDVGRRDILYVFHNGTVEQRKRKSIEKMNNQEDWVRNVKRYHQQTNEVSEQRHTHCGNGSTEHTDESVGE